MNHSILIIEDNDDIRECTAEILTLAGFNVYTSNCGAQAFLQIEIHLPDLIICDIVMPGMDGFEVLVIIRESELTKFIPFIFFTAKSEPIDKLRAKNLGVTNYLIKPFDDIELLNCIKLSFENMG